MPQIITDLVWMKLNTMPHSDFYQILNAWQTENRQLNEKEINFLGAAWNGDHT